MYPKSYIEYLVHFHGLRDYFECHEILEEYWKSIPKEQPKHHWVGLIQIAVGLYHQRRGNFPGAYRMIKSALNIVLQNEKAITALGLDTLQLQQQLQSKLDEIKNKKPYTSFNLPITDQQLLQKCEQECLAVGCNFGIPSDLDNEFLVHKHTLRDRQPVIEERLEQQAIRKKKREG